MLNTFEHQYNILPSRKYFTETLIPKLFKDTKSVVGKEMSAVSHLSLTTDIWSTDLNSSSLLSFTAHKQTFSFECRPAVLTAVHFDGSHTGEAICQMFLKMLQSWKLNKAIIHLII